MTENSDEQPKEKPEESGEVAENSDEQSKKEDPEESGEVAESSDEQSKEDPEESGEVAENDNEQYLHDGSLYDWSLKSILPFMDLCYKKEEVKMVAEAADELKDFHHKHKEICKEVKEKLDFLKAMQKTPMCLLLTQRSAHSSKRKLTVFRQNKNRSVCRAVH